MRIKEFLAGLKLRQTISRMESPSFVFPGVLARPERILVCLPRGLRELTLVKQFLPDITSLFKPAEITLLSMPGTKVSDIYPRKGYRVVTPTLDQLTWTGLPKKNFLKTLQEHKFDLLLDFNLESSVFTSGVLLSFPTALRIGRGNHRGNPYYNLEIKTKYLRDERNIYRSLIETLAAIKGAPKQSVAGSN